MEVFCVHSGSICWSNSLFHNTLPPVFVYSGLLDTVALLLLLWINPTSILFFSIKHYIPFQSLEYPSDIWILCEAVQQPFFLFPHHTTRQCVSAFSININSVCRLFTLTSSSSIEKRPQLPRLFIVCLPLLPHLEITASSCNPTSRRDSIQFNLHRHQLIAPPRPVSINIIQFILISSRSFSSLQIELFAPATGKFQISFLEYCSPHFRVSFENPKQLIACIPRDLHTPSCVSAQPYRNRRRLASRKQTQARSDK